MKRIFAAALSVVLCLGLLAGCGSTSGKTETTAAGDDLIRGTQTDLKDYFHPFDGLTDPKEICEAAEATSFYLQELGAVLDEETVDQYRSIVNKAKQNQSQEDADKILAAYDCIGQNDDLANRVVFLWGDWNENMPFIEGEDSEVTTMGAYLVKYLVDDQSTCKGNLLLCCGGPGTTACTQESNPAAETFNELGYNCFVFFVRGEAASDNISMVDTQRALKMVKYLVETEDLGGKEMIAGNGYSAGNTRLMNVLSNMVSADNASKYCSGYTADEVDAYSQDMDVYINTYGGPIEPLSSDIADMPALYLVYGETDDTGAGQRLEDMYTQFENIVPCKINMIAGAGHGFGVGTGTNANDACFDWPADADAFMQEHLNFQEQTYGKSALAKN